ncbi:MAG: hypothetical protein AABZ14_01430 [Candidatus Margulisiibacteriota bacterium]
MNKHRLLMILLWLIGTLVFPLGVLKPNGSIQLFAVTPTQGIVISANGNVGIGTTAPSTKLDVAGTVSASALVVNGAVAVAVVSVNTDVTLSLVNNTVLANAVGSNKNIALPSVASSVGRVYKISRTDTNLSTVVSILPNGTDTIGGTTLYTLFAQYQFVELTSDGVNNWFVTGGN